MIEEDVNNIFLIPKNKLHLKLKEKYGYILNMRTAGIL